MFVTSTTLDPAQMNSDDATATRPHSACKNKVRQAQQLELVQRQQQAQAQQADGNGHAALLYTNISPLSPLQPLPFQQPQITSTGNSMIAPRDADADRDDRTMMIHPVFAHDPDREDDIEEEEQRRQRSSTALTTPDHRNHVYQRQPPPPLVTTTSSSSSIASESDSPSSSATATASSPPANSSNTTTYSKLNDQHEHDSVSVSVISKTTPSKSKRRSCSASTCRSAHASGSVSTGGSSQPQSLDSILIHGGSRKSKALALASSAGQSSSASVTASAAMCQATAITTSLMTCRARLKAARDERRVRLEALHQKHHLRAPMQEEHGSRNHEQELQLVGALQEKLELSLSLEEEEEAGMDDDDDDRDLDKKCQSPSQHHEHEQQQEHYENETQQQKHDQTSTSLTFTLLMDENRTLKRELQHVKAQLKQHETLLRAAQQDYGGGVSSSPRAWLRQFDSLALNHANVKEQACRSSSIIDRTDSSSSNGTGTNSSMSSKEWCEDSISIPRYSSRSQVVAASTSMASSATATQPPSSTLMTCTCTSSATQSAPVFGHASIFLKPLNYLFAAAESGRGCGCGSFASSIVLAPDHQHQGTTSDGTITKTPHQKRDDADALLCPSTLKRLGDQMDQWDDIGTDSGIAMLSLTSTRSLDTAPAAASTTTIKDQYANRITGSASSTCSASAGTSTSASVSVYGTASVSGTGTDSRRTRTTTTRPLSIVSSLRQRGAMRSSRLNSSGSGASVTSSASAAIAAAHEVAVDPSHYYVDMDVDTADADVDDFVYDTVDTFNDNSELSASVMSALTFNDVSGHSRASTAATTIIPFNTYNDNDKSDATSYHSRATVVDNYTFMNMDNISSTGSSHTTRRNVGGDSTTASGTGVSNVTWGDKQQHKPHKKDHNHHHEPPLLFAARKKKSTGSSGSESSARRKKQETRSKSSSTGHSMHMRNMKGSTSKAATTAKKHSNHEESSYHGGGSEEEEEDDEEAVSFHNSKLSSRVSLLYVQHSDEVNKDDCGSCC
jgi:hypothetical protein